MNAETQRAEAEILAEQDRGGASLLVMIIAFVVILFAGMVYVDRFGGGFSPLVYSPYRDLTEVVNAHPTTGSDTFRIGQQVYARSCGSCHMANGAGQAGTFPPLAGSEWVNEPDPAWLIRIALVGVQGPITVKGQAWNLVMSANANTFSLTDEDVAAVLTYIRQDWGNKAPPVKPEDVKAVRAELGARTTQFTDAELKQIPLKK